LTFFDMQHPLRHPLSVPTRRSSDLLVGQFQKHHTAAVGLLLYTLGGKDRVNYLTGVGANPLRPFAETVTVPFQILLMGFRHVFCNRTVLPFTAIQTPMGCDSVVIVK